LALKARTSPSALVLTRQNLPQLRTGFAAENRCSAGAYELLPAEGGAAQVSFFATGSEVAIAVEARRLLAGRGIAARVVSVPCFELVGGGGRRGGQEGKRGWGGGNGGGVWEGVGGDHRLGRVIHWHEGIGGGRARQGSLPTLRDYGRTRGRNRHSRVGKGL